ncbi:unnamed protein product [Discula destructiva]
MAKKVGVETVAAEEPAPDAHLAEVSTRLPMQAEKNSSKAIPSISDENAHSASKIAVGKSNAKKRKVPVDDAFEEHALTSPQPAGPTPKKQKPKQKKNTKPSNEEDALFDLDLGINTMFARMDPDLLADYVAACTKRFGTDLSPVELSDLYVPAGAIRDTTSFAEARVKEKLPDFLESCVAGESEVEQKRLGSAPKEKGAPHTIIVAGAGLRAADLVRAARKFQKKDSLVAKLFAKHFKVAEQVDFLKKNRTGIAIGTPARLIDLLENGGLSVQHLKRIVIDVSHIDQKKRGIMDMKDTMLPLAKWLSRKEFKDRYTADRNPIELLFF